MYDCNITHCTHYIIIYGYGVFFMASPSPLFILCGKCLWCATYFDKTGLSEENRCPQCGANSNEPLPIVMSNGSFIFNHSNKRGVELKFMHRHNRNSR